MVAVTLRPSGAGQWVRCSASASVAPLFPELEQESAIEGTTAHNMAALVLDGSVSEPAELVDRQCAETGRIFDLEMSKHVTDYVNLCRSVTGSHMVEQSVSVNRLLAVIQGTADFISIDHQNRRVTVIDFKYGYRQVEVFENWQLLCYTLGATDCVVDPDGSVMDWSGWMFENVIFQPRGWHKEGPTRRKIYTFAETEGYRKYLYEAVRDAIKPVTEARYKTGSHCQHCNALPHCTVAKSVAMNAVDVASWSMPHTDNPEQLAILLDNLTRAEQAIKHTLTAIKAQAQTVIGRGVSVPGYDMRSGKGNRQFKSESAAIALGATLGIDLTDSSIVTPAEAERRGMPRSLLDTQTITPSTAPKLVKVDINTDAKKAFGN